MLRQIPGNPLMKSPQGKYCAICRFPKKSDLGSQAVESLSGLINRVYDEAESGMWKSKGTRTTPGKVKDLLEKNMLILAELQDSIVGAVHINRRGDGVGELECS